MRLATYGLCFLMAATSSACISRKFHGGARVADARPDPACPGGVLDDFKLETHSPMPAAASLDWPSVANPGLRKVMAPSADENLHLKLCLSSDYTTVQKVLAVSMKFVKTGRGEGESGSLTIVPGADAVIEGLSEALFQDYSKLRMELRKGDYGLFVKGWDNGGSPIATAEMVVDFREYEGDAPTRLGSRTVVGTFTEGNPFRVEDPRCGAEPYRTSRFRAGTAVLDTEQCLGPTLAGAASMRIIKVKIHDANPALGEPLNLTLEGAALESALKTRFYHHGGCTYFSLDAGRAQYGMRNMLVGSGCNPEELPEIVRSANGAINVNYGAQTMVKAPLEFHFWTSESFRYRPAKIVFREAFTYDKVYLGAAEDIHCVIPSGTELVADGQGPISEYEPQKLAIHFKEGSIAACPRLKSVVIDSNLIGVTPLDAAPL